MVTYKELFLLLVEALSQATADLEEQNYGLAAQRLKQAQNQCEERICELEE